MRWLLCGLAAVPFVLMGGERADATRQARAIDDALVFVPDGDALLVASSGFAEPMADLLWIRAVLNFGERYGRGKADWVRWLGSMTTSVTTLDPTWRTPYFFGGDMLRVAGDVDAADALYDRAMSALPNDEWFPFSRGMNAFLYRNDPAEAARYLEKAARLPHAPTWYAGAAAAVRARTGAHEVAARFLEEQLNATTDPAVRSELHRQLAKVEQDRLVQTWSAACKAWRDAHGALARPEDLALLGFVLPENPRGDSWIVGRDGVVRSQASEIDRVRRVRIDEWGHVKR